jgi:hypothetical protein
LSGNFCSGRSQQASEKLKCSDYLWILPSFSPAVEPKPAGAVKNCLEKRGISITTHSADYGIKPTRWLLRGDGGTSSGFEGVNLFDPELISDQTYTYLTDTGICHVICDLKSPAEVKQFLIKKSTYEFAK